MKKTLAGIAVVMATLLGSAGITHAISITAGKLLADAQTYSDTGAELVVLTDTDGVNDDSTVFLFLELAGYAGSNTLGIYDDDAMLQIFSGSASPLSSITLAFDLAAGTVTNMATSAVASIGKLFGFYIDSPDGRFFSEKAKNTDGFDHFLIFDTSDNLAGSLFGADVVLGIEDLRGGGDRDFNDMVAGATDLKPVPEPGTILLLGSGLLGIGLLRRRRRQ